MSKKKPSQSVTELVDQHVRDTYNGELGAPFDEPLPATRPMAELLGEPAKEKKKQHLISVPADLYETISRDAREGHRPLSWQIRLYVEAFQKAGDWS
jgi:hypothetical protein